MNLLQQNWKMRFLTALLILLSVVLLSQAQILSKMSGDHQVVTASKPAPQDLLVKVTVQDLKLQNFLIQFRGTNGAACVPSIVGTDANGIAHTTLVAGFNSGSANVTASLVGFPLVKPVIFHFDVQPSDDKTSWIHIGVILGVCCLTIIASLLMARWILSQDDGTVEMRKVSDPIRQGAQGFFKTQYLAITLLAIPTALILFLIYILRERSPNDPDISNAAMAVIVGISFLIGALCSGLSGFTGMWVSVRANVRVASAATLSYNRAIQIALRGGAFSGFLVVSVSVLGVCSLFAIMYTIMSQYNISVDRIAILLVGYGFGASFVALFAQLGGGIYTKAADVGADIIGKIEANIPEDDERNPAVIADLVGDNVGDCAGRGADLFESIAAENIGAMILAGALAVKAAPQIAYPLSFIVFPLMVHVFGLVASWIGIFFVRVNEPRYEETAPLLRRGGVLSAGTTSILISDPTGLRQLPTGQELEDPMSALNRGYAVSVLLAAGGFVFATWWLLHDPYFPDAWWHFAICGLIGIVTSWLFVFITIYYTDFNWWPVRRIALASTTGHGTNVIAGIAVGLESTALPVIIICIAILATYWTGKASGITDVDGVNIGGIFGTAVGTMGMLATAAFILAMDTFGPITDNAGGIVEMSHQPDTVRAITDRLDAVGNTTKALTKGYAIGSAALAAFLLFSAYMDEVSNYTGLPFTTVNLAVPEVFVGGLLGAALVFLFCSLAIRAVGVAAETVIKEVRRQFQEFPGIMDYSAQPDYQRCVAIVARSALKQMIMPGLLAVLVPVSVGIIFRFIGLWTDRPLLGVEVSSGFLMIATITGILMALFMNNGGGAWDNAKKYIEMGHYGGKGSETHKAAVTGDTVGDPFKDTAGPSIHVLIKLLSTITLVIGPLYLNSLASNSNT